MRLAFVPAAEMHDCYGEDEEDRKPMAGVYEDDTEEEDDPGTDLGGLICLVPDDDTAAEIVRRWNIVESDSCLQKLRPEEPFFVLRAQDQTAPSTVRYWVKNSGTEVLEKGKDALVRAFNMEDWAHAHGGKRPD